MVYRRCVKRGGKLYGPYYYESYRDENGKVVSRYLSDYNPPGKITNVTKIYESFIKNKRFLMLLGIILGLFLVLLIGNASYSYKSKTTGRVIESGELGLSASLTDENIAEKIARDEVKSDTDLTKKVNINVKKPDFDNKIMEFQAAEGNITLEFDLLNYSEWYINSTENELEAESFDIRVNESAEKYKWGYSVKLKDLNFMAKINVKADNITIIDNQTLKIGNYYLSFADLSQQNFTVSINQPVIISEINLTTNIATNLTGINMTNMTEINLTELNITSNLTNMTEINLTELNITIPVTNLTNITTNLTEVNITIPENTTENITIPEENATEIVNPQNIPQENLTEETKIEENISETEESPQEEQENPVENVEQPADNGQTDAEQTQEQTEELAEQEPAVIQSLLRPIAKFFIKSFKGASLFIINCARGITGSSIQGWRALTGSVVGEENYVSVYVEKDFANSSYNIGDLINLDPSLIEIMGETTPPDINFTYPTPADGAISSDISFVINASITNPAVTGVKFKWRGVNYVIFNSSVIAKYNFGNLSGLKENDSFVADLTGLHNGTVTNAVWISTGKSDGAYSFDGNGDYINLSSDIGISNNSGSVTVWFKRADVTSATAKYIFGHRTGTSNNRIYIYINGNSDGTKNQSLTCGFGNNALPTDTTSTQKINDSQWHFAAIVWNSYGMGCYLDASLIGVYAYSIPALDGLVTVGIAPSLTANLAFNGTIDELTIWNYTLSSAEINQSYFSFLSKYNSTDWNLYINQSKNPTSGLDAGTYSYFASASNANGENSTETRYYTVNVSTNITASDIDCGIESGSCTSVITGGYSMINFSLINDLGTMRYWFMFNITGHAPENPIIFNILNAEGTTFPITASQQPVYSYDNGATWSRIINVSYAAPVYTFNQTFAQDGGILVAVTFPFRYSDMQDFMNSLSGDFISVDNIGNSSQNRTMYLVTITNSSVDSADKKTVWVTTGQHAGETNGMWVTRGLIEFLTNTTNETAIDMRNNYIFKINPMMNPDGVYLGKTRDNANTVDLNREWDEVSKEPEVNVVFNNISNYTQTQKIDMFMDIHDGASASYLEIFTQAYIGASNYTNQTRLVNLLEDYTIYSDSSQGVTQGTARVEMFDQFAIFPSITLETYSGNTTYTIASLKQQGTKVALAVKDYFNISAENLSVGSCRSLSKPNSYYSQTADIVDNYLSTHCIKVNAQNITVDCAGHYISSNGTYAGVYSNQINTTVKNCNITMGGDSEDGIGMGVWLEGANNSYIFNNTLNNQGYGLYLDHTSGSKIENNTASLNLYDGLVLYYSNNNSMAGNKASFNSGRGIYIGLSSNNNLTNNTPNSNLDEEIFITTGSNNTLINNIIWNCSSNCLELNAADNTFFSGGLINYSSLGLILFSAGSSNNIFRDVQLSNGGNNEINLTSNSVNNTFVNCSYNTSKEEVGSYAQLIRSWYYQAYVNYTSGSPINNTNLTAYNNTGNYQFNLITNSSGWTSLGQIIDYVNLGGTRSYYSNYTIEADNITLYSQHTYNSTLKQYNYTDYFTLAVSNDISSCQSLNNPNQVYTLARDIVNNYLYTHCVRVNAQNITVDCAGHYISSDDIYAGVYSNQVNTTVKNCNITMGGDLEDGVGIGVWLEGANNSYIFNNTLNNQGLGLYLSSTFNSSIENNTLNSNSDGIIFLSSSSNNLSSNTLNYDDLSLYLYTDSNYNLLTNNNILNCTSPSWGCLGISSSQGNTISGGSINNSDYYLIYIQSSSNNTFKDIILGWSGDKEIYLASDVILGHSINNTFLNASYDISKEYVSSGSSLFRKWYYQALVTDNSSTPAENASVFAYNVTGDLTLNLTTNSSGWTPIGHIIDYMNLGGTRSYYSSYIMAANSNRTLWDSHNYNVTNVTNNLNDSFIVIEDITNPVLSGTSWSATAYTAIITWTTNEGSNSSVTYWASPAQTTGNNKYVISHSVALNDLTNDTTYSYTYTSCDFAGNCVTSNTSTFATASPGQTLTGSAGGGIFCIPNYKCSSWSSCSRGEQTRTCQDDNNCFNKGFLNVPLKKTETRICGVSAPGEPVETEIPLSREGAESTCSSNWKCENWSACRIVYRFEDLVEGNTFLQGEQQRVCKDSGKCYYDKLEVKKCDTKIPVVVRKIERCFRNYIEIRNENDLLISRLEILNETSKKLNIQMLIESEYCPYCYDGQKDYDEAETDCVYEAGGSCPLCREEAPALREAYSTELILLFILPLLFFIAVIWYLILLGKTREIIKKGRRIHKHK